MPPSAPAAEQTALLQVNGFVSEPSHVFSDCLSVVTSAGRPSSSRKLHVAGLPLVPIEGNRPWPVEWMRAHRSEEDVDDPAEKRKILCNAEADAGAKALVHEVMEAQRLELQEAVTACKVAKAVLRYAGVALQLWPNLSRSMLLHKGSGRALRTFEHD